MRKAGLGLITVGFMGGSLVAVLDKTEINPTYFVPFFILSVVGVVLVQLGIRRESTDESKRESNFKALDSSLKAIVENIDALDAAKGDTDVYALPDRIDELFRDDIELFVDARESILHSWGVHAYADVMSRFAAAERYLNRVWSTAADGYIDEAHEYLGRSHKQFAEALQILEGLHANDGKVQSA